MTRRWCAAECRRVVEGALVLAVGILGTSAHPLRAQDTLTEPRRLTRAQASQSALTHGARLDVARTDTLAALARLWTAQAFQNPTLSTSYSKATPRYHVTADLPIDYPWVRRVQIRAAQAGRQAAQYRYLLERAAVMLDADTLYTQAQVALAKHALSRRNAQDAESLRHMAVVRRDTGDASELEVELATVNAGQQVNTALADSLAVVSAILDLQMAIGLPADRVLIMPADSLTIPSSDTGPSYNAMFLPVAAADAALTSAQLTERAQHRSFFSGLSLLAGFETGDPSGSEPGVLPVVGLSFPMPLLNRNRGPIAQAQAERERAQAELALAKRESQAEFAHAVRDQANAVAKAKRGQALVASANRVAAMSLTAYREGASTLPSVLEAQRNARDLLAQYIDDLGSIWRATAALHALTMTPTPGNSP